MEQGHFALTYRNLKPGEFITFGTYPQSVDGKELPIKWRVLRNSGSELFVLSEYILDAAYMYMIKRTKITISTETAKKSAVPGGGCEHKETSLHVRFL